MGKILYCVLASIWCLLCQSEEVQQQCPEGFSCSKWTAGQDDCAPCESGYYSNTSGSASCTVCPAGYMCREAGKAPSPCPLGTYSSCIGQICCSACPLGTYTSRVGSIECKNCPAGAQCPKSPKIVCGGDILSPQHQAILTGFTGKRNPKWKLLYKATRDGFGSTDFHRLCDNHAPTMTVIQSTNYYLFGGYANLAWNSSGNYINDPHAFIFTLTNPNSIPPTRYLIRGGLEQYGYYDSSSYGPTFGGGHDIYLRNYSNATDCHTSFPATYTDTTNKGSITFTGNFTFRPREIEIYKLLG
ncbi:unnamed protein product [Adineta ricciae]|uniref:TLDc domain-containing protein n=1 Tax=Adineta ricciae TaxID=249248 RepID=A0A815KFE1_ADIRI|nr:unnamed protein product [Adineta ricciae]CAF1392164.1 unnamed protein product [Adineta ricciae]